MLPTPSPTKPKATATCSTNLTNRILKGQVLATDSITTLLQQATCGEHSESMPIVDNTVIVAHFLITVEAVATFVEPAPTPQEHSVTYIPWTIVEPPPKSKQKGVNGET